MVEIANAESEDVKREMEKNEDREVREELRETLRAEGALSSRSSGWTMT